MREERDLYNDQLELSGKTYLKGDAIPKGYFPMVVMIAIQNTKGEFLMQKRVKSKGGDWGVTGGHPKHGETPKQGIITEVKEELGIDITNQNIIEFERGCDGKDCYIMYYTKMDIERDQLKIQLEELSEVRWFMIEELQQMVDMGELNKDQVEFFIKCVDFLKNKEIND